MDSDAENKAQNAIVNNFSDAISSILKNLKDDVKELEDAIPVLKKRRSDIAIDRPKTVKEQYTLIPRRSIRTRRSSKSVSEDNDVDEEINLESNNIDSEVWERRYRKKYVSSAPAPEPLPPEEITQDMIEKIHKSGIKKYDSVRGVLCHQCRQKTLDTKTMCRSGKCAGGQGAFCGPCLYNHYGELVEDALKDPNWACPPCRNVCICSVHMINRGMRPAGTLTPVARRKGYKCVLDYLVEEKLLHVDENGIVED